MVAGVSGLNPPLLLRTESCPKCPKVSWDSVITVFVARSGLEGDFDLEFDNLEAFDLWEYYEF